MPADDAEHKKVPYEQAREAQELAHARQTHLMQLGQAEALKDILALEQKKGAGEPELEARREAIQEIHQDQLKELALRQQERMDRLEIEYKRERAGLDRERER